MQRKVAIVTGGAHPQGIGFASASKLVEDGFDVVVTGVAAAEVALTPQSENLRSVVLDVTDDAAVEALFAGFDRIDALVNCAGLSSADEFSIPGFARTLDVNLSGTMRCCLAAHPKLAQGGGAIVNIASVYAHFGSNIVPGYSASKGGVVQLTKSLAAAWGAEGVRVNAISPGWIRTALAAPVFSDPATVAHLEARTPLGRLGAASDCGDVVAFLCSPEARFVTGVTIPVDGGYIVTG